jgi:hypothetical protein
LNWWRGFGSKELSGVIEQARSSNLDKAMAVARIVQADAQSRITGAALLPSVRLNGEIDFWGKNRSALQAAEEDAIASRFERDVVELSTIAATANGYFQLLVRKIDCRPPETISEAPSAFWASYRKESARGQHRRSIWLSNRASSIPNVPSFLPLSRLSLGRVIRTE